jgi:O-antigen/teichoic acid export membrane protein
MHRPALAKYFRLKPFDTTTLSGVRHERYRLATWSAIANLGSRFANILVILLSVRLTLPYLGVERFGMWVAISSFVGMLSLLDLGVGNALTNRVALVSVKHGPTHLRTTIVGGVGLMGLLATTATAILIVIAMLLPWATIIKVTGQIARTELNVTILMVAILFGMNLMGNALTRVFYGLQRSFEPAVLTIGGCVISCMLLWFASRAEAGVPTLLLATLGVQSSVPFFLLLILIHRHQFGFKGMIRATRQELPTLLRPAGFFLILQLGFVVGWGADSLIIANAVGTDKVAEYGVAQRLFQLITIPLAVVNAPLWGIYADAMARHDHQFIAATLRRSLQVTTMIALLMSIVLVAFHHPIILIWTNGVLQLSLLFVALYACLAITESIGNAAANYLNGCFIIRPQLTSVALFCVLALPLKIVLVRSHGIEGVVFATFVSYWLMAVLVYGVLFRDEVLGPLRS